MSLAVHGLSYRYATARHDKASGIADATLDVRAGEFVAVIGPSGSGKSTLLKLIAGFLEPDHGRVEIAGADATALPPQQRALGVVFQSYALFPHMSVGHNVAYALKVRGVGRAEREARAREMLVRVGLADFADRMPGTLSGGQQQRVALARALVFEPHGLLLDEPLSALDLGLRRDMRDEIRRVQREFGIATLHVTHDQEEALSIADRVAVMLDGRIRQVAPPTELYDNPIDHDVAAFVGAANLFKGTVAAPGRVDSEIGPLVCTTGGRAPGAAVWALVRPERVEPQISGHEPGVNAVAGEISNDRFLGAVRRVDLRRQNRLIRIETTYRGTFAGAAIPPEAIRLLPRDIPSERGE